MKNKGELEKRFKEISAEIVFFSQQKEKLFDRVQELRAEITYFEKRIDGLIKEGGEIIEKL